MIGSYHFPDKLAALKVVVEKMMETRHTIPNTHFVAGKKENSLEKILSDTFHMFDIVYIRHNEYFRMQLPICKV
ncbi:22946_t:CDS:2 [Gigaspora margarita]|uniref:22946_t:CDS:1 n=1 Tax=Gigaspora margarita TaxID=4874 RepID=A0ABM8W1Q8_GIGMA|nr:22946_t:CDS:2 [Gigaspora margarita]